MNSSATHPRAQRAIELTREFVSLDSVTSKSNLAVSEGMQQRLADLGFDTELVEYLDSLGRPKVALQAKRSPTAGRAGDKGIGYFCHNDVVSVEGWDCTHGGPFDGRISENKMWGRGTCDMKGSAAAAMAALENIPVSKQTGPIYYFVTGDEECGMAGAELLANQSEYFREMVESSSIGIIGEPTELKLVNSHKGGCRVDVSCEGVAAHSSTADGKNANLQLVPFLSYLCDVDARCRTEKSLQNAAFSPSDLSINFVVENRPQSANITVGTALCHIFFRPMPDTLWRELLAEIDENAKQLGLSVDLLRPLAPVHTPAERQSVKDTLRILGQSEPIAVCYATDGCCLQDLRDMLVLGPGSIEQAHRPDEFISLEQLSQGVDVYQRLFENYACA